MENNNKNETVDLPRRVTRSYVCIKCGIKCVNKSNLNRHTKKCHAYLTRCRNSLQCPLCLSKIINYDELDRHLLQHGIFTKSEELSFDSKQAFEEWKLNLEKKSKSNYCTTNSRNIHGIKITRYNCHRSGTYTSKAKNLLRQRALKLKGTNKIGAHCPARIIAKEKASGELKVKLVKTHVGHEIEVGRFYLTRSKKKILANKVEDIPNTISEDTEKILNSNDRFIATTNEGIHNLKCVNVQPDMISFSADVNNVDILVRKFQGSSENPILAYKPYELKNEEIGEDNFFLIFMNTAQQQMLEKYGNDILMIDSTHGTNPYKIQLTTLMVVDSECEGFPVALMWSKLHTENIFQKFFACLKEKVPNIKPNLFMSDDSNGFYNGFAKEYNHYPQKLLWDWYVKRNLYKNLLKICVLEKRREVKSLIRNLINELDEKAFHNKLKNATEKLITDPETKKYGEYFQKYANRPMLWAHCFRKNLQNNTSMTLANWYQELKLNNSINGDKCRQNLDASICNVVECLRQKFLRKLMSVPQNRVAHKLYELRKRHKTAEKILNDTDTFENTPKVIWLVGSIRNKNARQLPHFYTVTFESTSVPCDCNLKCKECNVCIHMFSCDCHDYSVQFNMCKHIHLICLKYPIQGIITDITNSFITSEEHNLILRQFDEKNNMYDLELEKRHVKNQIQTLVSFLDKCDDPDTISRLGKDIKYVLSSIPALSDDSNHSTEYVKKSPKKLLTDQRCSFNNIKKCKIKANNIS